MDPQGSCRKASRIMRNGRGKPRHGRRYSPRETLTWLKMVLPCTPDGRKRSRRRRWRELSRRRSPSSSGQGGHCFHSAQLLRPCKLRISNADGPKPYSWARRRGPKRNHIVGLRCRSVEISDRRLGFARINRSRRAFQIWRYLVEWIFH
jgi:hypothetical protein